MRVAQLANFVGPTSGGMKTALDALGRGYVDAGVARLLVVPGPEDRHLETDQGDVVQLRAPRVGGGYRLIVEPWRVTDLLRHFAPTSLEVSDKSTLLPVTGWARRAGVASLLLSHERLDAMLSLRTGLPVQVTPLNRALVRRYDRVVVTSRYAEAEFSALAGPAATPLHRVPLGVDLETFRPAVEAAERGGPPGGAAGGPLRLVHAGRLSREKSPHLAVATAMALHRRGVPLQMDVYGDGPHRDELEALAAGGPVTFHGHVAGRDRLAARLAQADVSLSVCPGETFGLSVLEALACGTPVVTADEGGARELVDDRSGGWAPADAESLADAVLRVAARDPRQRRVAARRRAEQYPWSRTVEAMLDLHDLSRRPAGVAGLRPLAGGRRPA
ncbi:glycosyltransferase [Nocardioides sp. SYSU DS0663]|uniref:glycosyltransferase n=1 Tax=Nocardioides sp. SYSU DS0663 TaxID=3416445 RepID=UPI003F4C6A5D